ncbi:hypothetical protein BAE44_0017417 [Dichanthelium oligosanthes]|uniref:Uncharacterized protein n=1 Tax=Dichanthelium oligosanthes TaxID=888268 RepID=A0A1E5V8W8_9POAL|nr:hypothetical protein BAE44_0017417 [Dichanthelium oligosanthes]
MNTKHWSRSMKLVRTLRRTTNSKRPHAGSSSRVKAAAASSREASAADDQATPRRNRVPPARSGQNRRAVRVKVVLTRAEAARLLSLTAHGHRTAAQVVGELKRMQVMTSGSSKASTAHVINEIRRMEALIARADTSASASASAWRPVLESIPEEWQY